MARNCKIARRWLKSKCIMLIGGQGKLPTSEGQARVKGAEGLLCQTFEVSGISCAPLVFLHFPMLIINAYWFKGKLTMLPWIFKFSCKMLEPLEWNKHF